MVRSHWLRVCAARLVAPFRLAFAPAPGLPSLSLAAQRNSQVYSTKDTPQASCARDILPVHGFRFCFTPLAGVLFAFPSRYSFAIGSPGFGLGSSCPALLRHRIMERLRIRVRGCHPLRPRCPAPSASSAVSHSTGHPHAALQPRTAPVWAPPRSLAATCGISLDFLSRAT